jgi:hypothetical protein
MNTIVIAWLIVLAVLLLLAAGLGVAIKRGLLGILTDERGRYSLSRLQLVLWSLLILSLLAGVFMGRLTDGSPDNALDFDIPGELLTVMGISLGSTMTATAIKTSQNNDDPRSIAASDITDPPRLLQIFLEEKGTAADEAIDIGKFQKFWITVILVAAYAAIAGAAVTGAEAADDVTALPGFAESFVVLLGISHAAYLAGKLPSPKGEAAGRTMWDLENMTPEERKEQLERRSFAPRNDVTLRRTQRRQIGRTAMPGTTTPHPHEEGPDGAGAH